MQEACKHIEEQRSRILRQAESSAAEFLVCSFQELTESQGSIRLMCAHLERKFKYLTEHSYLLVRLPEPGIQATILDQ